MILIENSELSAYSPKRTSTTSFARSAVLPKATYPPPATLVSASRRRADRVEDLQVDSGTVFPVPGRSSV